MYPQNDYRSYLEHHGILGMKWGVQNGPPYPLGISDHNAAERKAGWVDSLKNKHSERKAEKAELKEQKEFTKEVSKAYKSIHTSGFDGFDELRRVEKISKLDKVRDQADDEMLRLYAKVTNSYKNPVTKVSDQKTSKTYNLVDQKPLEKYSSLCREKSKKLLGKTGAAYENHVTLAISKAVESKLGVTDVSLFTNRRNNLRKQLDRGKEDYGIPIKKNSAYEDYLQAEKDLSAAKKAYEANLKKYSG